MTNVQWFLVAFIAVLVAWDAHCQWGRSRLGALRNMAIDIYVRTGTKTEAFTTLSRRAVKAAEKQRVEFIRKSDSENRVFMARCACPACSRIDVHWIEESPLKLMRVQRMCRYCGHLWRQE